MVFSFNNTQNKRNKLQNVGIASSLVFDESSPEKDVGVGIAHALTGIMQA